MGLIYFYTLIDVVVLHCNANINEMDDLAKVIPKIDKFTQKKTSDFYNFLG